MGEIIQIERILYTRYCATEHTAHTRIRQWPGQEQEIEVNRSNQ